MKKPVRIDQVLKVPEFPPDRVEKGYVNNIENVIQKATNQLRANGYEPKAVWLSLDGKTVYVVTDDTDRSEYANLLTKFK